MRVLLKKYLVYILSIAIVRLAVPAPVAGQGDFAYGKRSAGEAAAPELFDGDGGRWMHGPVGHGLAFADTTEYEFPEEEENAKMWRDVVLWVVVAGFVAFFVIKVFLEGETDESEGGGSGKPEPTPSIVIPPPASPAP
jgi:hypothetical protein